MGKAIWVAFWTLVLMGASGAQSVSVPPVAPPDLSSYALKSDVTSAQSAVTALIPQPSSSVPPSEQVVGAAGTAPVFRRGDAVQPRITRSSTLTLDGAGTATFDWTSQGALSTPVQVALSPVYSGSGTPICWPTATSATAVSVKCAVNTTALLNLSIITAGLTLFSGSASGMSVGVIVLPPS